ncbi:hypothetical protein JB92DRAFT_3110910 [Gautieria morchelliformis]|nr:hypothetical protein JB92DRAFT_3110910 [Gautieria morchelliformis]
MPITQFMFLQPSIPATATPSPSLVSQFTRVLNLAVGRDIGTNGAKRILQHLASSLSAHLISTTCGNDFCGRPVVRHRLVAFKATVKLRLGQESATNDLESFLPFLPISLFAYVQEEICSKINTPYIIVISLLILLFLTLLSLVTFRPSLDTDRRVTPGHSSASAPFNLRIHLGPSFVVTPMSVGQVQVVVACAARAQLYVSAKSGGRSYAAYGLSGDVVVDINNILMFNADEAAVVQTGSRLGEFAQVDLYGGGKSVISVVPSDVTAFVHRDAFLGALETNLLMRNLTTFTDRPAYSQHSSAEVPFYDSPPPEFSFIGNALISLAPRSRRLSSLAIDLKIVNVVLPPNRSANGSAASTRPSSPIPGTLPTGSEISFLTVDSVKGLSSHNVAATHMQVRFSLLVGPFQPAEEVYTSSALDMDKSVLSELKFRRSEKLQVTSKTTTYLRTAYAPMEFFARIKPMSLECIERWDEMREQRGLKLKPEANGASGLEYSLSVPLAPMRCSETDFVVEQCHDVFVIILFQNTTIVPKHYYQFTPPHPILPTCDTSVPLILSPPLEHIPIHTAHHNVSIALLTRP